MYMAFVGADVLTMTVDTLVPNQTVIVRDGSIREIGPRSKVEIPSGARVIEAAGHVLMPGLIDAHVHLRAADSTALVDYLRTGITTAREMNGRPFLLEWRSRIDSGTLIGPSLVVAAPTLANFSSPREGYPTPETAADAAKVVRDFASSGYDWIKVYSFLPADAFSGVMTEANRLGLPVGGHAPLEPGLEAVLNSGIRSIEHLTEYVGSSLTSEARGNDDVDFRSVFGAGEVDWLKVDSLVQLTAERGVWNVPTLVWFDRNLPAPMAADAWSKPELRAQGERNRRDVVRRLYHAGAKLAVGTDSDAGDDLPASAIHDELEAMVSAGLDPYDVIHAATVGGATMLGRLADIGSLETGKRADLLLLRCNPVDDLVCLRQPEVVVSRGRIVYAARSGWL